MLKPLIKTLKRETKQRLRNTLLFVGLDVRRVAKSQPEPLRFLTEYTVPTILDIGANTGQFAQRIRSLFPRANIHSFEPLPSVFSQLKATASRDPRWSCYNLALGATTGEVMIEENEFSPSSSLLPMLPLVAEAFPYTAKRHQRMVHLQTLDRWADALASDTGTPLAEPLLIKLDVQGYEDRVLRGGERTFARASIVLCEVSFVPLYKGQVLFDELYARLHVLGFVCAGIFDLGLDPRSERVLYADAIFVRPALLGP